jgi:divalent metal cation (Fe/Co/Zn/Cd) transporter
MTTPNHPATGTQHAHEALTSENRTQLGRRAQFLAAASVSYNLIEAVIAITAGVVAGSVALVGFGLDSIVEVSSGLIILWQFRHRLPESRERQALRLMAFSFFALAAYVTFESVRALLGDHNPEDSPVGIGLAIASLVIMPFLSWAQRRTGKALGSNAVVADSTQTLLCTYLSAVLLVGLVLNATLGWSWADPIAGLIIAGVAVKEGREAWRGEGCCGAVGSGHGSHHETHGEDACCSTAGGCTAGCCAPAGETQPISDVELFKIGGLRVRDSYATGE